MIEETLPSGLAVVRHVECGQGLSMAETHSDRERRSWDVLGRLVGLRHWQGGWCAAPKAGTGPVGGWVDGWMEGRKEGKMLRVTTLLC